MKSSLRSDEIKFAFSYCIAIFHIQSVFHSVAISLAAGKILTFGYIIDARNVFNEIVQGTMKSKQVWMKSKSSTSMKLNPSFILAKQDFITE